MTGDPGPYIEMDGPSIWVPRTVPYREARHVAREAIQEYGHRLVYVGKVDAFLLGFTRDCFCEDYCQRAEPEDEDRKPDRGCRVPAWHFRQVEP